MAVCVSKCIVRLNEIDMGNQVWKCIVVAYALFSAGCEPGGPPAGPRRFLFLGHPYDWRAEKRLDPRLEAYDYSAYEEIWLGGDVCARTAKNPATMDYLDSVFNLERTHWALGNHDWDYGERENVLSRLPSPPYYTVWKDGFCLTVLNTNLFWPYPSTPPQENCTDKMAQWQMVQNVADTISEATHWVILHHHALFSDLMVEPQGGDTLRAFNVNPVPFFTTCDSLSELTATWYPELARVKQRGVEVVCIGGDFGMRAKQFEFQTPEGIWLLGSGINNSVSREYAPDYVTNFGPDHVLELWYQKGLLEWAFVPLGGD